MNFAEVGLTYVSVLLIGVFVSDRIAIAQWGLTRTIVGLLRGLCIQMTLPLAAELGHDHAIGAQDSLQRLYARGSIVLTLFASLTTSGALVFWPDFFEIWTHGAIPYDATLAITLLLGMCVGAPAILALSYANYSNRGPLLLWTKSLQLALFLLLSIVLIPRLGSLGAAIALVSSDIIAQFGVLFMVIVGETLKHPIRHTLFLLAIMVTVVSIGPPIGAANRISAARNGNRAFRRRMRVVAGRDRAAGQPAGKQTASAKTDGGDPALAADVRAAGRPDE